MPLISGTIGAGLQYAAQKQTNETNLQIAQETNELNAQLTRETNAANIQMNRENNLLQQELAKQSHEWSTAANQLQELMAAGLTEQQARQAIAGAGVGSSSFPVATTQPGVAEAPHYETPQVAAPDLSAVAGVGSEIEGSIFGALGQSLTAADGGALGWSVAQDYISGLMKFAEDGKIDFDNLGSPADLMKFATGLKDGELKTELMEFLHGDAAKKVRGFVPAQRALYSFLQSNMGFKTQAQQVRNMYLDGKVKSITARKLKVEITGATLHNALTKLDLAHITAIQEERISNSLATLSESTIKAQNQYDIYSKNYDTYVRTAVQDADNLEALAQLTKVRTEVDKRMADASDASISPELASILSIFDGLNKAGILQAKPLSMVWSATAVGSSEISRAFNALTDFIPQAGAFIIDESTEFYNSLAPKARQYLQEIATNLTELVQQGKIEVSSFMESFK